MDSRAQNLQKRKDLLDRAEGDRAFQQVLWERCKESVPFWMRYFCWTYNPKIIEVSGESRTFYKRPFVPWDYQVSEIIEPVGRHIDTGHDLAFKKSRDMGATWCILAVLSHRFIFSDRPFASLLISRAEKLVESTGNPDALFWKVDYLLDSQPEFFLPDRDEIVHKSNKLHRENPRNGAVMDGEATTEHMSAGGRRSVIFLDEFARVQPGIDRKALAATRDSAACRLFCSTSEGRHTQFYRLEQSGKVKFKYLHWSLHPYKGRGLYKARADGKYELLDDFKGEVELYLGGDRGIETFQFPDEYPFETAIQDKNLRQEYSLRSPWFDSECNERSSTREIAQQLEMDDGRAGESVMDQLVLERIEEDEVEDPLFVGELEYKYDPATDDVNAGEFQPKSRGDFQIWIDLGQSGRPPQLTRYVVGCDISQGTGASNSTAAIYNAQSGVQVGELATPNLIPEKFARLVVSMCKWLGGVSPPLLVWEKNGPGANFTQEVQNLGYGYVLRDDKGRPGFHTTDNRKRELMGDLRSQLSKGDLVPRSQEFINEAGQYVVDDAGRIVIGRVADQKSGARTAHGDRVIAHCMAMEGLKIAGGEIKPSAVPNPPESSWEARRRKRERKARESSYWAV